jgi:hypothetical protein
MQNIIGKNEKKKKKIIIKKKSDCYKALRRANEPNLTYFLLT